MKKFQNYYIPTSWNEITLKQQLEVERLTKEHPEYSSIALIAGYLDQDVDQIKRLHINEIKNILHELTFISTAIPNEVLHEFMYKGEKYTVMETLLKGQFQDFLTIETVLQNHKGNEYRALPYIIAVLAKKQGETLDSFDLEERAKHFMDLPLLIANNIYFFFAVTKTLSEVDSKTVLQNLDQQVSGSINSLLGTPMKRDGGGLLIRLQKVMLRTYLKYLLKGWRQYYSGFNSGQERTNWIQRFKGLFRKKLKRK